MTSPQLLIKNNNIFVDVAPLECAGSQYYFSGLVFQLFSFPSIFFSFSGVHKSSSHERTSKTH